MVRYIILLFSICMIVSCREETKKSDLKDTDPRESLEDNNIRNYLIRAAGRITDHSLSDIADAEDWESVRDQRYREFLQMISLVSVPMEGERPPLNVTYTGTIQQEGFRIEKLYYESLPGLYVPANLYVPDDVREPVPAILYLCGHSRTQKTHYQAHPRKLTQLGFVCLIVETIQWGEVYGEHWGCYSKGWFNWYSRGYTPAGVEVWNGIRGLDLLSALHEVDPDKLGITGISGGGAISWFLGAADPRVRAVAPVCGNSTLSAHIDTRTVDGHCDCMMMINTCGRDFQDIGALIAPRPLFIAQADRDGLNTIESSYRVYNELKDFYGTLGAEENIGFISTPGGHSYHRDSRQAIFSFFLKHLMGKDVSPEDAGDISDDPESTLDDEALRVFTEGIPVDDRTRTIQDTFIKLPGPPEITGSKELEDYRNSVVKQLKDKTFHQFPAFVPSFDSLMEFRTLDGAAHGSNIYSFVSEEGWRLKIDFRWRNPADVKKPLMIVLRSPGEARWASEAFAAGIPGDWNIAYFETRGVGEFGWSSDLDWHVRRASAWTGRTIASMRTFDVLRCIEFCRSMENVEATKIGIAAREEMAVVALFAALLDGRCHSVRLMDPPSTLDVVSPPDGRGMTTELLNVLQIIDINQVPALLYPSKVMLVGNMPESYAWSAEVLNNLGAGIMEIPWNEESDGNP